MNPVELKPLNLKTDSRFDERGLQEYIIRNPDKLGLGDVAVIDQERIQDSGGRLDILLEDQNNDSRYEVEIQLGGTDETHIIRTIEYWDNERKKYPQYNHTAVIIAEEITGRFFNVIGLFNGFIPIMAINVTAVELPKGELALLFTKILDSVNLGIEDEPSEPTDRNYWETVKSTPDKVALADRTLEIVREFAPSAELNYNQHYIGFRVDGKSCNFATFKMSTKSFWIQVVLPQDDDMDQFVESAAFDSSNYRRNVGYRHKFSAASIDENRSALKDVLEKAYLQRNS